MTLSIDAFGARIDAEFFNLTEPDVRRIHEAWASCVRANPSPAEHTIHFGLTPAPKNLTNTITASTVNELDEIMTQSITEHAIDQRHTSMLLLHAAGVLVPETGRVLALVAPSGTGKTTAALALSAAGYCTDETVAVSPSGLVTPYPKPLSVIERGNAPKTQIGPTAAGLTPVTAQHPIGGIVVLQRDTTASQPQVEDLDLLEAITLLAPQVSYLAARSQPLHQLRDLVNRVDGVRRVRYSEATDLIPLLAELSSPRGPERERELTSDISPKSAPVICTRDAARAATSPILERTLVSDSLRVGDTVVLLNGRDLFVLSAAGSAIWIVLSEALDLEELGHALGVSDSELLRHCVDGLISAGVLRPSRTTESVKS